MSPEDTLNLELIVGYCEDVFDAIKRHGDRLEDIEKDIEFQYVCSFLILQIGEKVNKLSVEFVTAHPEMPWRKIVGMRNILVHNYGVVDVEILWNTIRESLPPLYSFCKEMLGV